MKQGKKQGQGWLVILIAVALLLSGCAGTPTQVPPVSPSSSIEGPASPSPSPSVVPTPEPSKSASPGESPPT
ncbi:MAG: hypothetical protein WCP58_06765, partial [bacterium]